MGYSSPSTRPISHDHLCRWNDLLVYRSRFYCVIDHMKRFYRTCSLSTVTLREKRIRSISDSTSRFSRSSIFFALSNDVNYIKTCIINKTLYNDPRCNTTLYWLYSLRRQKVEVSNLEFAICIRSTATVSYLIVFAIFSLYGYKLL